MKYKVMEMKKYTMDLFFFLMVIAISSCNNSRFELKKVKDIEIMKNDKTYILDYFSLNNHGCFTILNYKQSSIDFFDIEQQKVIKQIPLNNFLNNEELNHVAPYQFYVHNTDSVFIGLSNSNTLYLLNGTGQLEKHWDLNAFLYFDVELVFLPSLKLEFVNNLLLIGNASTNYVGNPEGRISYFSTVNPAIIFDIIKDSITIAGVKFPQMYQGGQDYRSYHASSTISENYLIYSFALDHRLFIYNTNGIFIKEVECKSKYWKSPTPFPDDSSKNYYFLRKYNRSETRYDRVIYDKFNKLYYRLVNLSSEYKKEDGTIKEFNNWSCIILNENFEILNEISFNSEDYYPYYFIPTPAGIFIGNSKNTYKDNSKIHLSLFKPTYGEK